MSRIRLVALVLALGLVLGPVGTAGALVSTGHSGWSWADPPPQGEGIRDLAFSGSTGYAVGGYGALLRTSDGGETWNGLPSRTLQDLTRVGVAGPGNVVASGACAVRRSTDDGATFRVVDVGGGDTGCGASIQAASFPDPLNGMILLSNGIVLATADGGVTLARRTPVPGGVPGDLVAVSPTTAFAISAASIYRTTDGGGSWTLVAIVPRILRSLTFVSATTAYAAGDDGTVLRSVDGGASWVPAAPAADLDLTRVRCADASVCLFTTTGGALARTTDGGASYTQVTPTASPVRAVAFASPTRVVAAGDGGTTAVSDDAGATWRTIGTPLAPGYAAVAAGGGDVAVAVSPTAISLTTDGGATWRSVGLPTSRLIVTAAFADPLTGYAQDDGSVLWRTTDGGVTWRVLDPGPATGPLSRILTAGGGRVLLVAATRVLRSADGGDTFTPVASAALRAARVPAAGLVAGAAAGRHVLLVGRRGLVRSRDGGATWARIPLPRVSARAPRVARADCVAPATCWIVTSGSRLYRTTDAGRRWTDVTAGVGVPLSAVTGVAAGARGEVLLALRATSAGVPQGSVLHTSDGGRTWAPQLVGRSPIASIDAAPGRAWALSGIGAGIFTTTTGGRAAVPTTLTITATPRRIRRATTITVRGRLRGAEGGEQVTVYATGAPPRTLTVASSGTFSASVRMRGAGRIVAQWAGDGVRAGDGSPALRITRRR